jgi:hypothetical protein
MMDQTEPLAGGATGGATGSATAALLERAAEAGVQFESEERSAAGGPLCFGALHDLSAAVRAAREDDGADVGSMQNELIAAAVRARRNRAPFPPPYLLMDVCDASLMPLRFPGAAPPRAPQGMMRILLPAAHVVDLGPISNDGIGGMSVVRCNAALPVYRWFLAANLQLDHRGELGRVMPFPLDQPAVAGEDGEEQPAMTTFQFLRCTQEEHATYRQLLDFAVLSEGLEKGFGTAARYSYEALRKRGVSQLTHEQVDRLLTRVVLKHPSELDCVVFAGLDEDRSADAELLKRHQVLRC